MIFVFLMINNACVLLCSEKQIHMGIYTWAFTRFIRYIMSEFYCS